MSSQLEALTEKIENIAKKILRYSGFDGQYINGAWRPGHGGHRQQDLDPYTGEAVPEITVADQSGVDEAYQSPACPATDGYRHVAPPPPRPPGHAPHLTP